MGNDRVQQIVEITKEEMELLSEIAESEGVAVEIIETTGFEPISTVTLALVGSALAVGSVVYWLERRKGGQVVDLRLGADRPVYRNKDLAYGLVLIYLADGQVRVEVKEPKGMLGIVMESITGILAQQGGSTAVETATALEKVVGPDAVVSVEA